MRKGCLGILIATPLLIAGGVAAAFWQLDQHYGLREAAPVSHERFAETETRLRVVLKPRELNNFVVAMLPQGTEIPYVPVDLNTAVDWVMPQEAAVLARPDYRESALKLTVFINERRGGPALPAVLNQTQLEQQFPGVEWQKPYFTQPERGLIRAQGAMPLPMGLETYLLDYWAPMPDAEELRITGEHTLELLLDNRSGDALALWAAYAEAAGQDWRQIQGETEPRIQALREMLLHLRFARITADLITNDSMRINLHLASHPDGQMSLMALPLLVQFLNAGILEQQGLVLEGNAEWDEAEEALIGEYMLTGFERPLREAIERATQQPQGSREPPTNNTAS